MRVYLKNTGGDYVEMVADSSNEVLWHFVFDDLENPTNYVAERAYSLKLPRCAENNAFFGHFCHLDSVILGGVGSYTPTEKMAYMITCDNGSVLSTGDAVITSIDNKDYTISLVGSQARIFRNLLNAGYNTAKAAEDSTYYLMTDWLKKTKSGTTFADGENIVNATAIYASWLVDAPLFSFSTLKNTANLKNAYGLGGNATITETLAFIASLVGFAPTSQGRYKGFENDIWLEAGTYGSTGVENHASTAFLPVLCNKRNAQLEPMQSVDIKDGTVEVQMCEYRSYYQQPFIYLSALWQMFAEEFESITGYTLQLDNRWFNGNGELDRLVWMLPKLWQEDANIDDSGDFNIAESYDLYPNGSVLTTDATPLNYPVSGMPNAPSITLQDTLSFEANKEVRVSFNADFKLYIDINPSAMSVVLYPNYYNGFNPILLTISAVSVNSGRTLGERRYAVVPVSDDGEFTIDKIYGEASRRNIINLAVLSGYELVTPEYSPWSIYGGSTELVVPCDMTFRTEEDGDVLITVASKHFNAYAPFTVHNTDSDVWWQYYYAAGGSMMKLKIANGAYTVSDNVRTGSVLSLERLFRSYNPFDVLLCHSKMWHLLWRVDDTTRTVSVIRAADFFADNPGIEDVSGSVDSSTVAITPLSWTDKSVVFNLAEIDCDGIEGYEKRHGITYGSQKLITQNNNSNSEKKLLGTSVHNTVNTSALFSERVAPVALLMRSVSANAAGYVDAQPMPLNVRDGEFADISGNFYYRHANGTWPSNIAGGWSVDTTGVYARISDDISREVYAHRFCWHGASVLSNDIKIYAMPVFNTVSGAGVSVLFAPTREQYTDQPDTPTAYGYGQHWKNYVEEVYNAQNKTVACEAYLTMQMVEAIRRFPVVQLGNILYIVTGIDSWGERHKRCKITMRQISNLTNLTT